MTSITPSAITVNLENVVTIDNIVLYKRYQSSTDRYWGAKSGEVFISIDGENYTSICTFTNLEEKIIQNTITFHPIEAQYVKIIFTDAWARATNGAIISPAQNLQIAEIEIY